MNETKIKVCATDICDNCGTVETKVYEIFTENGNAIIICAECLKKLTFEAAEVISAEM